MGEESYKFGEAPGLPAVEHAKKRSKAAKVKEQKERRVFYTIVGEKKLIMLTVKPNGCYRSYFGNVIKMGKDLVNLKKKKWKEEGQWLEPHEIEEKVPKMIEQMQRG